MAIVCVFSCNCLFLSLSNNLNFNIMSETSEKLNKGLLSITFALEVIIDAAGVKTYLLRETRAMQPLSMTTEPLVLVDRLNEVLESFQNQPNVVRQG